MSVEVCVKRTLLACIIAKWTLTLYLCSFDTEVRDSFYDHMCDPFFTGVDHMFVNDPLKGPPQFEMVEYTPVEYEAVEYDEVEYETVDYEEFTK